MSTKLPFLIPATPLLTVSTTEEPLLTRVVVRLFRLGYNTDKRRRHAMGKRLGRKGKPLTKRKTDKSDMDKLRRKYQAIQQMGK
jgi:hypothetical protein